MFATSYSYRAFFTQILVLIKDALVCDQNLSLPLSQFQFTISHTLLNVSIDFFYFTQHSLN